MVSQVSLLLISVRAERLWFLIHTAQGPLLVGTWYRPPANEDGSIWSCFEEHGKLCDDSIGCLLVGDLNVHHKSWLSFSSGTTPCGETMRQVISSMGLKQVVKKPTRGPYLLDLVLTDLPGVKAEVMPKIADHNLVQICIPFATPTETIVKRDVWQFRSADWDRLRRMLGDIDWSFLRTMAVDLSAQKVSHLILEVATKCINRKAIREHKTTHPWLNERVLQAVDEKRRAEGGHQEKALAEQCSIVVMQEYGAWCGRIRDELSGMKRGSKQWWARERQLQQQKQKACSIGSLKDSDGNWMHQPVGKANLLSATFQRKCELPGSEKNAYTELRPVSLEWGADRDTALNASTACDVLNALREESATGPDLLPARILRNCAASLATPIYSLAVAILNQGVWPSCWKMHWVVAIYKKKAAHDPSNYRGVHLTAQLAKVMERLLQPLFGPTLMAEVSIGPNQFAYCRGRGSRDVIAFLMLSWLTSFQEKKRIAVYLSDVSGAFDKVARCRLLDKLKIREVPADILKVFSSWLDVQKAVVVLNGAVSEEYVLQDSVFQGTVWGPGLWNTFFADASEAIRSQGFTEIVFADDLNALKEYDGKTESSVILDEMGECQEQLHEWGRANQVTFDSGKESKHILSRSNPHGDSFKLLGVTFDCKLVMTETVLDLAKSSRWKLKAIMRTKRYNTDAQLVALYKAQLLSFIEYRTPAIYHACSNSLAFLDAIQDKLAEAIGVTEVQLLTVFRLAPLSSRRDMALLGVIHRAVLGRGPRHFTSFFRADEPARQGNNRRHRLQLQEPSDAHWTDFKYPGSKPANYIAHSMLGLIRVYNRLPAEIVESSSTVSSFQTALQDLIVGRASSGAANWSSTLSPRVPWYRHPLSARTLPVDERSLGMSLQR